MTKIIFITIFTVFLSTVIVNANSNEEALVDTSYYMSSKLSEKQIKILSSDLLDLASYYLKIDDYNKAQEYYYKYISIIDKSSDNNFKIHEYLETAKIFKRKLFFDIALEICFRAMDLAESSGDIALMGKTNNQIGNIYIDYADYEHAYVYFNRAKENYKSINNKQKLSISYTNLGELNRLEKNNKEARELFIKSISIAEEYADSFLLAINYYNLAFVHIETNKFDLAYKNLIKSNKLLIQISDEEKIISVNVGFAYYYFKTGKYNKSIEFYNDILAADLSGKDQEYIITRDAEKGLYEVYSKLKIYKEALTHYEKYNQLNSLIYKKSKQQRIYELQFQNRIKLKKNEIKLLKEKIKSEENTKLLNKIIFLIFLGLIILLIYTVFLQRRSIKQKTALYKQKNELQKLEIKDKENSNNQLLLEKKQLETKQEINKLTQKNLEENLDHKKRELSLAAMHSINKNEILMKVKDSLDDLKVKRGREAVPIIAQINREIVSSFNIEDDWESFKFHFESVHQGFFKKLLNQFPDLTTEELKLCAYLRINLNSKEISRILNITIVAINKRRNRLRKKIKLDKDGDLIKFMIEI